VNAAAPEMTLAEIARKLGVSRTEVKRDYDRAMYVLAKNARMRELHELSQIRQGMGAGRNLWTEGETE
jgi:hypothetical protein